MQFYLLTYAEESTKICLFETTAEQQYCHNIITRDSTRYSTLPSPPRLLQHANRSLNIQQITCYTQRGGHTHSVTATITRSLSGGEGN